MSMILNITSLAISLTMVYRSYKKSNLVSLIYWGVFIFLVVGQAVNISYHLKTRSTVLYVRNYITREGHELASWLLLLLIIFIVFLVESRKDKPTNIVEHKVNVSRKVGYRFFSTCIFFALTIAVIGLVGVQNWLSSSRPVESGTTFLIIGITAFSYPLLIKLVYNMETRVWEKVMFISSILVAASFSRFIAMYQLLIFLLVYIYKKMPQSKFQSLRSYKKQMIIAMLFVIILFFGVGSYRHALNYTSSASFSEVVRYIWDSKETSLLSLDLNYRVGIEGMSGFSGALSSYLQTKEIRVGLGLPLIDGFINLIPGFARGSLTELSEHVRSFYWYKGSVVPGGVEAFFVNFYFLGIILFPFIFAFFGYVLHEKLKNATGTSKVKYAIIATYGLGVIRGSLEATVFFILAEVAVFYLSVQWFHLFYVKTKQSHQSKLHKQLNTKNVMN